MPSPPSSRRRWLGALLFAAGVALFVWLLRRLDLEGADIREAFGKIGWWFAAILGLTLVRFALRTAAWLTLSTPRVPFAAALAATLSGDALGNVLPLGLAASEPAKAMYLRRHGEAAAMFASLAAENFFYSVSVALYVIVAGGVLLLFPNLDPAIHLWGLIALGTMAAVLSGALWLAWQKPAMASAVLMRLPFRSAQTIVARVQLLETNAYGAAGSSGKTLAIVTVCEVSFHLLSLVECWLTFWLLTGVTSWAPALVYDGFNRVVNIVFKPVPARMGVEEGGTAVLADAIGYSHASGFLLAVVRKVRMVIFAAIGLALWARHSRR